MLNKQHLLSPVISIVLPSVQRGALHWLHAGCCSDDRCVAIAPVWWIIQTSPGTDSEIEFETRRKRLSLQMFCVHPEGWQMKRHFIFYDIVFVATRTSIYTPKMWVLHPHYCPINMAGVCLNLITQFRNQHLLMMNYLEAITEVWSVCTKHTNTLTHVPWWAEKVQQESREQQQMDCSNNEAAIWQVMSFKTHLGLSAN